MFIIHVLLVYSDGIQNFLAMFFVNLFTNGKFVTIFSFLFGVGFQWGLGLYGKLFPATGLLIVVALLPVQAWLSRWWLANFMFGPVEWLWRYWTYGQAPPMRRISQVDA
jgi:uncharacterized membrane protein YeiB